MRSPGPPAGAPRISGPLEVLAHVHVDRYRLVDVDLLDQLRVRVDQRPRARVALQREHLVPDLARQKRRTRPVPKAQAYHRRTPERVHPRERTHVLGGDPRLVGQQHDRGIARVVQHLETRRERRRLPLREPLVHDDPRDLRKLERVAHPLGVVAEHHDDLAEARARRGVDRVLDQGLAAHELDLLGAAEPSALARGQDDRGDHEPSRLPNRRLKRLEIAAPIARSPSRIPEIGLALTGAGTSSASIVSWRQSANCWVSRLLTSGSRPRDSCATEPVSWISARIFTVVSSDPGSSQLVMTAFAAPLPLASMPLACRTTRWAWSSRSSIATVPANASEIGPSFMLTLPFQVFSSIVSVSSEPCMHGAVRSTSSSYAQSWSTGALTVNSFSISTLAPIDPDARAYRAGADAVPSGRGTVRGPGGAGHGRRERQRDRVRDCPDPRERGGERRRLLDHGADPRPGGGARAGRGRGVRGRPHRRRAGPRDGRGSARAVRPHRRAREQCPDYPNRHP